MSILPDEEKRIGGDERHNHCGNSRRFLSERRCESERFFAEEVRYAEHEEQAGENADSECGEQWKRPSDLTEREQHEEYPPPERARGEPGEESGEQVFPSRHGSEFGIGKGNRILPITVCLITEVRRKSDEPETSEPLYEKHVRPRIEGFENVLGQKYEDGDVGKVRNSEHERERQAGEESATAVENGSGKQGFGMSRPRGVDEPESDGQREQPPESGRRRIVRELGHALQDLAEKIRAVHGGVEKRNGSLEFRGIRCLRSRNGAVRADRLSGRSGIGSGKPGGCRG